MYKHIYLKYAKSYEISLKTVEIHKIIWIHIDHVVYMWVQPSWMVSYKISPNIHNIFLCKSHF